MAPKRRKPRIEPNPALLSLAARPGQCPNSDLVSSLKSLSDAQRRRRRVTPPPRGAAFDLSSVVWQKCCRGRGQRSSGRGRGRRGTHCSRGSQAWYTINACIGDPAALPSQQYQIQFQSRCLCLIFLRSAASGYPV